MQSQLEFFTEDDELDFFYEIDIIFLRRRRMEIMF